MHPSKSYLLTSGHFVIPFFLNNLYISLNSPPVQIVTGRVFAYSSSFLTISAFAESLTISVPSISQNTPGIIFLPIFFLFQVIFFFLCIFLFWEIFRLGAFFFYCKVYPK